MRIILFMIALASAQLVFAEPDPHSIQQVDTVVANFMAKYKIPGVSIAITKNGKLVYAKGYGLADSANASPVTTQSLFRIASVSKPVTSIAIMKLVESGRLTLDEKVFGPGALLDTQYGTQPYGQYIQDITVRHLLQHTAGGWSNQRNDPMFSNPTLLAGELISWTLDNRPLDHAPGTAYAYSNFGYCILGRIIEKITGLLYETFVKDSILRPAGVYDMQVGGNTLADRKPNEVVYYGQNGQRPYAYNISRMDAHGGWIASATDLLRLLVRVDSFPGKPDLLLPSSIEAMTTISAASGNYACGWHVNSSRNWWHNGSLPGTGSELVRTSKGYNWAILVNTRSTDEGFFRDMDRLIWKAVNNPDTHWPDKDLFKK